MLIANASLLILVLRQREVSGSYRAALRVLTYLHHVQASVELVAQRHSEETRWKAVACIEAIK